MLAYSLNRDAASHYASHFTRFDFTTLETELKFMFLRFQEVVEQGIERKLHLGVQASLSYRGKNYELAYGESRPGTSMNVDTKLFWLSACKPIAAVATLILQQRGQLCVDDPVSKHLSCFTGQGKEQVTIKHILSHTAGLKDVRTGWPETDFDVILARLCETPVQQDWIPGQRAAYVPAASWILLGEIIAQASEMPFPQFAQQEILEPLQMKNTVCVSRDTAEELTGKMLIFDRNEEEIHESLYINRMLSGIVSPGSCFAGPACDLRRFYDALRMSDGIQQQILSADSIQQMTTRHRENLVDETFRHKLDFGLGVIINSNRYGVKTVPYGYGVHSSESAFGHGGSQSSIGFADPQREMSVVIIANGRPGEGQHQRRFRHLLAAMEEDLQEIT